MRTLKPCPFPACRSTRTNLLCRKSENGTVYVYFVQCKKCLCHGPEFGTAGASKPEHAIEKDKAIEAWNRRLGEWSQKMNGIK